MENRSFDPSSRTIANVGRLSTTTVLLFPFSLTEDAVTKMICALRSRRQPIDCFSYLKIYKQLLVQIDDFEFGSMFSFEVAPDVGPLFCKLHFWPFF
jgi:hypothetical protein